MATLYVRIEPDVSGARVVRRSLDDIKTAANATEAANARMGNTTTSALHRMQQQATGTASAFRSLTAVMGPLGALFSARQLQLYADGWSDMQSRVGAAIRDMDAAPEMMQRIVDLANASYSPLSQTAEVFARNVSVLQDYGRGAMEAADFTEALNHALVINATKGQDAEVVLNAYSRALANGKLQAQDFDTIVSRTPRLLEAVADYLGTNVTGLRALAMQGKVTGEALIAGPVNSLNELSASAKEMPATIGDAFQRIGTNLTAFIGQMDKASGTSEAMAERLVAIADDIETVMAIGGAGVLLLAARLGGPYVAANLAAAKSVLDHAAALASGNAVMINGRRAAEMRATMIAQNAMADQLAKTAALEAAQADLVRARNLYAAAQAGQVAGVTQTQAYQSVIASSRAVVVAQTALATSSGRTTAAVAAQTVAMQANTLAARAMAGAASAASTALAAVGGPAGAAMIALAATFYVASQRAEEARERSERYADIIRRAGENSATAGLGIREAAEAYYELANAATTAETAVKLASTRNDMEAFFSSINDQILKLSISLGVGGLPAPAVEDLRLKMHALTDEFKAGRLPVEDYISEIDKLSETYPDASPIIAVIQDIARNAAAALGILSAMNAAAADAGQVAPKGDRLQSPMDAAQGRFNEQMDFSQRFGGWEGMFPELFREHEKRTKAAASEAEKLAKQAGREAERMQRAYEDMVSSASDYVAAQQLEASLIGMSEQAAQGLRFEMDLLNEARRAGAATKQGKAP